MIEESTHKRLVEIVGEKHVRRDLVSRRTFSRDYSWISPILRRELGGMVADVIVTPTDTTEVSRVLSVAFDAAVPVTARGKGTGNYGQAVPLAGGIVLDTSALCDVVDLGDGWITADAGCTFARLEANARGTGQELAMFPSTVNSCLGGFLGGGAGGIGSIEHGFMWDGFVTALEVVPCVADANTVWVEGSDLIGPFLHAYGTTGVIAAATVKLVPARRWTALFCSFATWQDGLSAAWDLVNREPLPRCVSVDEPALVALFPPDPAMPPGRISLRAIVREDDTLDSATLVTRAGGHVEAIREDATDQLVSLSFNHVTLRAVRARPELCHLQVGGQVLAERPDEVRACLPAAMLHVDCHRWAGGPWLGGLLLSVFQDGQTLATGIANLERLGVLVINPHDFRLGGHGDLGPIRARAAAFDPKGLLNPGKLPTGEGCADRPQELGASKLGVSKCR